MCSHRLSSLRASAPPQVWDTLCHTKERSCVHTPPHSHLAFLTYFLPHSLPGLARKGREVWRTAQGQERAASQPDSEPAWSPWPQHHWGLRGAADAAPNLPVPAHPRGPGSCPRTRGCPPQHPPSRREVYQAAIHERGAAKYIGHKKTICTVLEWFCDLDTPHGAPKAGDLQACPTKTFAPQVHVTVQGSLSSSLLAPGDTDVTFPPALLSSLLRGILGCSEIRCPLAFQMSPLPAVACPCFPAIALGPAPENVLQQPQLPLLPTSSHGNTGKGFYF